MVAVVTMLLMVCSSASSQIVVLDQADNHPVASVSVYNNDDGTVVGITDFEGRLPANADKLRNISLHHINYYNQDVDLSKMTNCKILLKPYIYNVAEVKVTNKKADFVRMKIYVRQYSVLNKKPAYFRESIGYLYFNKKDLESKPAFKRLSQRVYKNQKAFEGETTMLKTLAMIDNPCQYAGFYLYEYYDNLKGTKRARSKWKRGGGFMYMNEDNANKRCEIVLDSLLADKPYSVPLFGFSFGNIHESNVYSTEYGKPEVTSLQSASVSWRIYQNKSKRFVDNYADIYVLETEYVGKEEKKADKKAKPVEFVMPDGMPPLNENIVNALKSMTKEY